MIPAPHNLHNYDELGVKYLHRPFSPVDDPREVLGALYPELRGLLVAGTKVIMHIEEVSDRLAGVVGGYIRWSGLVTDAPTAIAVTEKLTNRQLEPLARSFITVAVEL